MTLDVTAVETFTKGRLSADDDETQRQLDAALAAARRYCGWHVTPVLTQTVILDGPGGPMLILPTQKLTALSAVTEDGVSLNLNALTWSRRGYVTKRFQPLLPQSPQPLTAYTHDPAFHYRPWNFWTDQLSGVTATISHGYTTAEAVDFEAAVLSITDRMSQAADGGPVSAVGPFRFDTSPTVEAVGIRRGSTFSSAELAILDKYRLETSA